LSSRPTSRVYAIIADLIEIGLDVLNPVQRSAANLELGNLKREFGKDLCFWGEGVDIQQGSGGGGLNF